MSYGFDVEINKIRVGVVCTTNLVLNEDISRGLNGECVLHGEGEYVTGYSYFTYDENELEMTDYIRGYVEGQIKLFERK
jgi:hypothetical protein